MSEPKVSVVKVKRVTHPNEGKYPGRMTYDHNLALCKITESMTEEEKNIFSDPEGIVNQDRLQKFLSDLKEQDIVGIETELYVVDSKTSSGLVCSGVNKRFTDHLVENKEIDTALAMGFCEILYRDKKPYGVSETVNVKIVDYLTKEEPKKEEKENV